MNVLFMTFCLTMWSKWKRQALRERKALRRRRKGREIVITMLPNSPQVRDVVLGPQGIAEAMTRGSILIDMSSIAPLASREIGETLEEKGIEMLDAPVSGGEPKAIDGTLSIMVGGKREVYEKVRDLLLCMGSSAVYCGTLGAGNTTKLSNQIVVAMNIAACAEAFTLAKKSRSGSGTGISGDPGRPGRVNSHGCESSDDA